MGKGRYLKAAERACARKSRFETRAAAEAFVQGRYRSYRCVVCGAYHLTSGRGDRAEPPEPPRKEPSGPKLGDLDWSAVLDPKPRPARIPPVPPEPVAEAMAVVRQARCVGAVGKDGRMLLVLEGRLIKSAPASRELRAALRPGAEIEISPDLPPRVLRIL